MTQVPDSPPRNHRIRLALVLEATVGGTRRHLLDLLMGLDPGAFDLHAVISLRRDPEFKSDIDPLRARGVNVHVVGMERDVALWKDRRAICEMARLFDRIAPDVVHAHGSKGGYIGRLAAARAGVDAVVHTAHVYPFQWMSGFGAWVQRRAERRCDAVTARAVALTKAQADFMGGFLPAERIAVIPNGIDPASMPADPQHRAVFRAALAIPASKVVIGTVGRLAPQKAPATFLASMQRLVRNGHDVYGVMAGRGRLAADARFIRDELGLGMRMRMLGHRKDARSLYQAFDIFALPSLYEGFPYTLLDAMAAGLPVVTTDWPGAREIVDESCGMVTPVGDADALAKALDALVRDADLRARLGQGGRARVDEKFTLRRFLDSHEAMYRELAARKDT
jgi:glycosyltransferase involved in cell wall biosynthesis